MKKKHFKRIRTATHNINHGTKTFITTLARNNHVKTKQTPSLVIFEIALVLFIIKLICDYLIN
ncbi:hypothetical protein [Lacticaseibacillus paracasei]|uniref:hypothetical protein n=1 Tax=Lacticaseibacillus paracasei TaxID=1597 RepID=UPI0034E83EE9